MCGVDADHLPLGILQRPARVAGIQRCVRLITPSIKRPERSARRSSALTTPAVTVCWKPSGLPMAITGCPTVSRRELPRATDVTPLPPRITARSVSGSSPTSSAGKRSPLGGDDELRGAMHDMTVGEKESIRSKDKTRAGAAAPALLPHLNVNHRGPDALHRADDRPRVSIEPAKVGMRREVTLRGERGGRNVLCKPINGSHGMWMPVSSGSIPGRTPHPLVKDMINQD